LKYDKKGETNPPRYNRLWRFLLPPERGHPVTPQINKIRQQLLTYFVYLAAPMRFYINEISVFPLLNKEIFVPNKGSSNG